MVYVSTPLCLCVKKGSRHLFHIFDTESFFLFMLTWHELAVDIDIETRRNIYILISYACIDKSCNVWVSASPSIVNLRCFCFLCVFWSSISVFYQLNKTPLDWAIENNNPEMQAILRAAGGRANKH